MILLDYLEGLLLGLVILAVAAILYAEIFVDRGGSGRSE